MNWCSPGLVIITEHIICSTLLFTAFSVWHQSTCLWKGNRYKVNTNTAGCTINMRTCHWQPKPKKPQLSSKQPVSFSLRCAPDRTCTASRVTARFCLCSKNCSLWRKHQLCVCVCVCARSSIPVRTLGFVLGRAVCLQNVFVLSRLLFFQWPRVPSCHAFPEPKRVSEGMFFGQPHHNVSLSRVH